MNNIKGVSVVSIILWCVIIVSFFLEEKLNPTYLSVWNILLIIHTLVCFIFIWFELKPLNVSNSEIIDKKLKYVRFPTDKLPTEHLYLWLFGFCASFLYTSSSPLSQELVLVLLVLSLTYLVCLFIFIFRYIYLHYKKDTITLETHVQITTYNKSIGAYETNVNRIRIFDINHIYIICSILLLSFLIIRSNICQLRNYYGNEIIEPDGSNLWRKHGYTYEDNVFIEKNGGDGKIVKAMIYSSNIITLTDENTFIKYFSQNLYLKDILDKNIPKFRFCESFEETKLGKVARCSDSEDNDYTIYYSNDGYLRWLDNNLSK